MFRKCLSGLFFGKIGRYVKEIYKNRNSDEVLSISDKYSLNKFFQKQKSEIYKGKLKKSTFIGKIIKKNYMSFGLYILALITVMVMGNVSPLIYERLLTEWKLSKENMYFIYCILAFLLFQIVYSFVKNHSAHLKWKLIIAIDHNTKNFIFRKMLILGERSGLDKGEILNLYTLHSGNMRGIVELLELAVNALGIMIGIIIITVLLGVGGLVGSIFFLTLIVLLSKSIFLLDKYDVKIFEKNRKRIKLVSEILEKYKEVRLNNFEKYCGEKINQVRREQLEEVKKKNNISLLLGVAENGLISLLIAVSIIISILVYNDEINPANILSAFLAFNFLEKTVQQFFMALDSTRICMKSLDYILDFISEEAVGSEEQVTGNPSIVLKDVCFRVDENLIIDKLNLEIKKRKQITISGKHASGKSTILNIISKNIIPQSGTVDVLGKISYIKKEGWFLDESIKDNIILGKEFEEDKYLKALRLSCLSNELGKFVGGDCCVITDGGKNLSGGQAVRIQLARAIYQGSDIILLDDVLNAIDIDNRKYIVQNLIRDFWKNKILVMVTNEKMLIDIADENFCIENGRLRENKYLALNKPTENMLKGEYHKTNSKCVDTVDTKEENNEKNSWDILKCYLECVASKKTLLLFGLLFVGVQLTDFFLKIFISEYENLKLNSIQFIGIYLGIIVIGLAVNFMRYYIVYRGNIRAGQLYHERLIRNILNVHYAKIDNVFIKKSLATATRDINILDNNIVDYFVNVFDAVIYLSVTLLLMFSANSLSAIAGVIFLLVFIRAQKESRKVTNIILEKSNNFKDYCTGVLNNIYNGIREIEALNIQEYIVDRWEKVLGCAYDYEYTRQAINRYELQKIDLAAYGLLGVFMMLSWKFSVDEGMVAIILMYILTMISEFENMLRNIRHAEIGIESLKRLEMMQEYANGDLKTENYKNLLDEDYDIVFENVSGGYGAGQYIFDKISFQIKKGERVLIQGASGIGKTTLFNCLENLINYEGNIYFRGVNIKNMETKELRNKICVITQENLILDENLSENLDPYHEFTYEKKIEALKSIGWKDYDLQANCGNLSKSERLLIALARVYLKNPDVLLLDESIANVDEEMWKTIKLMMESNFDEKTVLSISHSNDEELYTRKIILL